LRWPLMLTQHLMLTPHPTLMPTLKLLRAWLVLTLRANGAAWRRRCGPGSAARPDLDQAYLSIMICGLDPCIHQEKRSKNDGLPGQARR
jgi:hypothetical protein